MKIGIDARMYGPKQGGLGRYVQQLITHLEQIDQTNEYIIFLRRENWDEYQPTKPNFHKTLADIKWYGWREQYQLTPIIKRAGVDLMHYPHWNVPLTYHRPFIVTIHDLLLLHHPSRRASTLGWLTYGFKYLIYRLVLHHAITTARQIIAPSEFTKQDIIRTFKTLPDKITVAHLGVSNLTPLQNATSTPISASNAERYKPYVLYVGVAYPHKNLDNLLAAWDIFTKNHGDNYQLLLTGPDNYFYHRLRDHIATKKIKNVATLGFTPDDQLTNLYRDASLYVFPSLYEGFGMPPLEAMAYGIPVAASNTTCLPEILQDAALYFDPHSPPAIAEALGVGLDDQNLRAQLKIKAQKLTRFYSWRKTARQTLSIYEKVDK